MADSKIPARAKEIGESYRRLTIDDEDLDEEILVKAFTFAESGSVVTEVRGGSLRSPVLLRLSADHAFLIYKYNGLTSWFFSSRKLKRVPVSMLIDVRYGWNTDRFHKMAVREDFNTKISEEHCFSIVFRKLRHLHKTADFITASPEQRKMWLMVLRKLLYDMRSASLHFNEEQWLRNNFRVADINNNGKLSFYELWELLKKLGVQVSKKECKRQFALSDTHREESEWLPSVDFDEFVSFFYSLTKRVELKKVMRGYSERGVDAWTAHDLKEFLGKCQGFDVSLDECKTIIHNFEPVDENKQDGQLSVHGFRLMLLSKWGSIMKPAHASTVFQDMNLPLHAYFVHSTHNTYLLGNQLRGNATIEGYIRALKCGARVLELDLWEGDDDPIVTHGRTLVKPTNLVNVVEVINIYAFNSSPYPLILSLENHCGVESQRRAAHIFLKIFKDKIYIPPSSQAVLPSPEQLKYKILLKCKKLSDSKAQTQEEDDEFFDDVYDAVPDGSKKLENNNCPIAIITPGDIEFTHAEIAISKVSVKREKVPIAQEFSDIIALKSVKLKDLMLDAAEHPWNGVSSLAESKAKELIEKQYESLLYYTSRHLVKVYPSGKRTASTNTHPVQYWTTGIQQVTMNCQTADEELDLSNGLFSINDSCGYVLKPKWMRDGLINYSSLLLRETQLTLRLQIISAQCLPRPETKYTDNIVDPYVTVEIFGFTFDCQKYKTGVVKANGFNPVWDCERFEIKLKVPEIALIRFCVKDHDWISMNDFIGQYTVPVMSITQGYSHIPLETGSAHLRDPSAALFVHVEVEQRITEDQLTSSV